MVGGVLRRKLRTLARTLRRSAGADGSSSGSTDRSTPISASRDRMKVLSSSSVGSTRSLHVFPGGRRPQGLGGPVGPPHDDAAPARFRRCFQSVTGCRVGGENV